MTEPFVTCYTIISRDVKLLDWCIKGARSHAGIDHKWLVIGWGATQEIQDYCKANGIQYHHHNPTEEQDHEDKTSWFLHNLYSCWNAGYECATTPLVARMGSDQAFSSNWLARLVDLQTIYGDSKVYHTYTIESPVAKNSRHLVADFGTTPQTFNRQAFGETCNDIIHSFGQRLFVGAYESGLKYMHPKFGFQYRCDGVTWLQRKGLWEKYGPMLDRVVDGVAPDVQYMDVLNQAGVISVMSTRSISYHLVRGESREIQE